MTKGTGDCGTDMCVIDLSVEIGSKEKTSGTDTQL